MLCGTVCSGQDSDSLLKNFSLKWQADSLGKSGFRSSHLSFDSTSNVWRINGIDLTQYSKEKVLSFLGKPNDFGLGKEDRLLTLIYTIERLKRKKKKVIHIYFNKFNNADSIFFMVDE